MLRRPLVILVAAALVAALPAAAAPGDFAPKTRVISRTTLAGVTPKLSYTQVKARWGREPLNSRYRNAWGRHVARWGNYDAFSPTAAFAFYGGGRVGSQPFMYTVDLAFAARLGIELRTPYGDRAGTPARVFRRHWPGARRIPFDYQYTYYVVQSAYRGWRLAFLFDVGQLKEASFMRAEFVAACLLKECPNGYPPRSRYAVAES